MAAFEPVQVAHTPGGRYVLPCVSGLREIAAAVIYQALRDLSSKHYSESARQFLLGEGEYLQRRNHLCQLCECDEMLQKIERMVRAGVKFDMTNRAHHSSLKRQHYPHMPQSDST